VHSGLDKPVFSLHGISKQFAGVYALKNVDFEIYTAEVVALIGENGAGKSTLMKILGGIYQPDAGDIRYSDRLVTIPDVKHAIEMGIAFVHQELSILDNLDIAGNMFLGREPLRGKLGGLINKKKTIRRS